MYKIPNVNQIIPTHPLELPRIEGYRPYGFDDFENIYDWVSNLLNKREYKPFHERFSNGKDYIFINCESFPSDKIPHYKLNIEVGFVDFQDQTDIALAGVNFCLFQKFNQATVVDCYAENRVESTEIDEIISTICNGRYLKLSSLEGV